MVTATKTAPKRNRTPGAKPHPHPLPAKENRTSVRDRIADRIIELLDRGELPPWEQGWNADVQGQDRNAVNEKPYRGINRWLTLLTRMHQKYEDNRWLTFLQAKTAGGSVKKGEKGTTIVFWMPPKGAQAAESDPNSEKRAKSTKAGSSGLISCLT